MSAKRCIPSPKIGTKKSDRPAGAGRSRTILKIQGARCSHSSPIKEFKECGHLARLSFPINRIGYEAALTVIVISNLFIYATEICRGGLYPNLVD